MSCLVFAGIESGYKQKPNICPSMAIQKCGNQRINLIWQFVRELEALFQLYKSQFSVVLASF